MIIPVWPSGLPQEILLNSYSESFPNNLLKTEMETGIAKVRRRMTSMSRPIDGGIVLTKAQVSTFKTFFNTTLSSGAYRFEWTDPITEATVEMRFTSQPTIKALSGELFDISLPLEILP